MAPSPADRRKRDEIAERYDHLNANLWLGVKLSEKIIEDLTPILGADRDPFRDYCNGRISRTYFLSLHPVARHLLIVRGETLRLVSEIESRETEIGLSDDERDALQYRVRDFTNLTIDQYPQYIDHITAAPTA